MKCADCNTEFTPKNEKKEIEIDFSNPGAFKVPGTVFHCPKCGQRYCSEKNMLSLIREVDKKMAKK